MRVMHVLPNAGSGIESLVTSLLPAFRSSGVETDFVYLSDEPRPRLRPEDELQSLTILNIRKAPVRALRDFRHAVRTRRPDILHTHSMLPSLLAVVPGVAGLRHIRTVHAPYPYFHATDLRSALKRRLEGWALASTGAELVCVSQSVATSLPWSPGTPPLTILNGVTPPATLRTRSRVAGRTLLAVGRLEDQKGYPRLLEALLLLLPRFPALELAIAGEGSQRARLEATIREHGLDRNVSLLGHRTDVAALYQNADIFVCSSNYEGVGLATMEALCSGCRVVSTPIGPSYEIDALLGGNAMRFAGDFSASALARAIAQELESAGETDEILARRVREACQTLSVQGCAEKYLDLYRATGRARG